MATKILGGAEPFFFPGGSIGCLCSHGLTASPQEVYWLGKYLAERGATVYGPRLYGHGLIPEDTRHMRWQDWYLSLLDGYHLLRQRCDHIFVMGLSLGGLLSLLLAANETVNGAIPIAAPLSLPDKSLSRAHLLRYVMHNTKASDPEKDRINQRVKQLQEERGERITGRVAYYRHSAVGVSELLRVQAEVSASLARITAPTLLIFSEGDRTVPISNADLIASGLTHAKSVEMVRFTQSDHILTNDVEHQQVFAAVWAFIEKTLQSRAE